MHLGVLISNSCGISKEYCSRLRGTVRYISTSSRFRVMVLSRAANKAAPATSPVELCGLIDLTLAARDSEHFDRCIITFYASGIDCFPGFWIFSCLIRCDHERPKTMISGNHTNEELALCRKAEQPAGSGSAKSGVSSSSRHWPPSTESRIVRVSRVFGGKDRHSKVRTVKGLRDRRVRLSVPTAIQLYDLQDRLGLSQPSKVVDWLIDAAQHEIDKLPPLQFPPHAQDLVAHLHHQPSSMLPPFANAAAADASSVLDADDKAGGIKALMGLNNSFGGLVNGAMPLAHGLYFGGESWSNGSSSVHDQVSHGNSPHQPTVAHHSPFSSLLSLAPGPQLVFYSPEGGGFAMKEAPDHQFPVDNLEHSQGQLSLGSARSFLNSGSQG